MLRSNYIACSTPFSDKNVADVANTRDAMVAADWLLGAWLDPVESDINFGQHEVTVVRWERFTRA